MEWSAVLAEDVVEPDFRFRLVGFLPRVPGINRLRSATDEPPVIGANVQLFQNRKNRSECTLPGASHVLGTNVRAIKSSQAGGLLLYRVNRIVAVKGNHV